MTGNRKIQILRAQLVELASTIRKLDRFGLSSARARLLLSRKRAELDLIGRGRPDAVRPFEMIPTADGLPGNRASPAALPLMTETVLTAIENSFRIAWDYLAATGELGDPDTTAHHLLDTIETMVRRGERRQLLLANKAIASYQHLRAEQGLSLAS